jgi:hypothetical protein
LAIELVKRFYCPGPHALDRLVSPVGGAAFQLDGDWR